MLEHTSTGTWDQEHLRMTDVALQPGRNVAEHTCCDVTHEHAVEADHHCGVATSLVPKLSVFLIHYNYYSQMHGVGSICSC